MKRKPAEVGHCAETISKARVMYAGQNRKVSLKQERGC